MEVSLWSFNSIRQSTKCSTARIYFDLWWLSLGLCLFSFSIIFWHLEKSSLSSGSVTQPLLDILDRLLCSELQSQSTQESKDTNLSDLNSIPCGLLASAQLSLPSSGCPSLLYLQQNNLYPHLDSKSQSFISHSLWVDVVWHDQLMVVALALWIDL